MKDNIGVKELIVSFLLLVSCSAAQSQTDFHSLLATSNSTPDEVASKARLQSFVQDLTGTGYTDHKLLRRTFSRVHTTFLKRYEAYSGYGEIFITGRYDCLTATVLFSQVLDQLKFPYDVIETNYHIFLMVKTSNGDVLLETTDRVNGFVTGEKNIKKRLESYHQNIPVTDNSNKITYRYSFDLHQKISPDKLVGLLYFNQAIKAYNQHDWLASSKSLEKSHALYASPRCDELGGVLIQTVLSSTLDAHVKAECLGRLRKFWAKQTDVLASN